MLADAIPELAQGLGGGPTSQREVEAAVVVFVLSKLLGELGRSPEDHMAVELVVVRSMAALDLAVDFGGDPAGSGDRPPRVPAGVR